MTAPAAAAKGGPAGHSPPDDRPPRLDAKALRCTHGGPFDMAVRAGECVAVLGRSGIGKSVLLRMIADLDPHAGEVWLDGRPRASWPAPAWRAQVVYQAAEPAWWAPTPAEHMGGASEAVLGGLLDRLGLAPAVLQAELDRLSTGERQRLALVRSLARRPRVLLLDEPTASLDEASTLAVEGLLADALQRDGLAIVLVTHSRAQAHRLADRLVWLDAPPAGAAPAIAAFPA